MNDIVNPSDRPQPQEPQLEHLEQRLQHIRELKDRKLRLELEKIELKRRAKQISDSEASKEIDKLAAKMADDLVGRSSFRALFCDFYRERQSVADAIEAYAELALYAITSINPIWIADQITTSIVSVLTGAVLINKTAKAYCS